MNDNAELLRSVTNSLQQGKSQEALIALQRILEGDPGHVEANGFLFQIYLQLGHWDLAVEHIMRATQSRADALSAADHLAIARIASEIGRYEDAVLCCQRSLAVEPGAIESLKALADHNLKLGRWDRALLALADLKEREPSLWEPDNKVYYRQRPPYREWQIYTALGNLEDDLAAGSISVEIFAQGRVLALSGNLLAAHNQYNSIGASADDLAEAHFNIGLIARAMAITAGRTDLNERAFHAFKEAVRLKPQWSDAYMQLGLCSSAIPVERRGSIVPVDCLRAAIELNPQSARAHKELGSMLRSLLGNLDASYASFTEYYRLMEERCERHPLGKLGLRFIAEDMATAIGHLGQTPDLLLKSQILGLRPKQQLVLAIDGSIVSNHALLKEWSRHITVITDPAEVRRLRVLKADLELPSWLGRMPDGSVGTTDLALSYVQREWERQGKGPVLQISEELRERGCRTLEEMGVPRGAWFVTLHVRENSYKGEAKGDTFDRCRNADPTSYLPAVRLITEAGGWVIRLGEPLSTRLPEMEKVIDYAHSAHKSDWMDIFLSSQCRFFLGGSGGIVGVPQACHVPLVGSDFPPNAMNLFNSWDIFMPKLLYSHKLGRLLTLREQTQPPYFFAEFLEVFDQNQVDFVCNSPDEILEATREMIDRLDGRLSYSKEDEAMQEKVRSLIAPKFGIMTCRVARDFLRKHADLL